MPALFLSLLATALVAAGASEGRLVARLSARHGAAAGILVVIWLACAASSALAAAVGAWMAPTLSSDAKLVFAAIACLIAGAEVLLRSGPSIPAEPTHSLGAAFLVLLARQVTDAARFLVLALAVATGAPVFAAIGGTLGSAAVLSAAWAMGELWPDGLRHKVLRGAAAGGLLLAAGLLAMKGMGLID